MFNYALAIYSVYIMFDFAKSACLDVPQTISLIRLHCIKEAHSFFDLHSGNRTGGKLGSYRMNI